MKILNVLIIIVLLGNISLKAQNGVNNFYEKENTIYWQKIYKTDLNKKAIINAFKESGIFSTIIIDNNKLTGTVSNFKNNYKLAGYNGWQTPIFISDSYVQCYAIIDIKENRYRVTLKNINFKRKFDPAESEVEECYPIEDYALKNQTKIKSSFQKLSSKILNFTFTNKFQIKKQMLSFNW